MRPLWISAEGVWWPVSHQFPAPLDGWTAMKPSWTSSWSRIFSDPTSTSRSKPAWRPPGRAQIGVTQGKPEHCRALGENVNPPCRDCPGTRASGRGHGEPVRLVRRRNPRPGMEQAGDMADDGLASVHQRVRRGFQAPVKAARLLRLVRWRVEVRLRHAGGDESQSEPTADTSHSSSAPTRQCGGPEAAMVDGRRR